MRRMIERLVNELHFQPSIYMYDINLNTGKTGNRNLPATVAVIQTATQHWLFRVPDLSAEHPNRYAVVGFVLDQS